MDLIQKMKTLQQFSQITQCMPSPGLQGEWGSLHVGDRSATGSVLDQETYDKWESECEYEGEFELL